jgi:hypothetical protein
LQVVVVIGNSLGFELVIVVSAIATVPVLVNVMTPPVNDIPPTTVFGNEKLSGVIVICGNAASAPAPDTATETLPTLVVIIVICAERAPAEFGLNWIDTRQVVPGASAPGTLQVVVSGNSLGLELVMSVS